MTEEIEELSTRIHQVYCRQYKKNFGKEYKTGGDYSKLDEPTKDYDRALARWHLSELKKAELRARIQELTIFRDIPGKNLYALDLIDRLDELQSELRKLEEE